MAQNIISFLKTFAWNFEVVKKKNKGTALDAQEKLRMAAQ